MHEGEMKCLLNHCMQKWLKTMKWNKAVTNTWPAWPEWQNESPSGHLGKGHVPITTIDSDEQNSVLADKPLLMKTNHGQRFIDQCKTLQLTQKGFLFKRCDRTGASTQFPGVHSMMNPQIDECQKWSLTNTNLPTLFIQGERNSHPTTTTKSFWDCCGLEISCNHGSSCPHLEKSHVWGLVPKIKFPQPHSMHLSNQLTWTTHWIWIFTHSDNDQHPFSDDNSVSNEWSGRCF